MINPSTWKADQEYRNSLDYALIQNLINDFWEDRKGIGIRSIKLKSLKLRNLLSQSPSS